MVECARLEIVYTRKGIKGSNPFVSARIRTPVWVFFVLDEWDENPGFEPTAKGAQRPAVGITIPSSPPEIKTPVWVFFV